MSVAELCASLDGMFSFVLLDESVTPPRIIAARDPIGITTLYQGWSSSHPGRTYFASELKALVDDCDKIISFPPGHFYDSSTQETTRYYEPTWWNGDDESVSPPTNAVDFKLIRETLEAAVRKRLMSEVPFGVLLSGGLDSSLIAAIAVRETEKIAFAQSQARQRRLAANGASSPIGVTEEGRFCDQRGNTNLITHGRLFVHSYARFVATASLFLYWPAQLARPSRRT